MEEPKNTPQISKPGDKKPLQKNTAWYILIDAGIEFALMIGIPLGIFVYLGQKYGLMKNLAYVIPGLVISLSISTLVIAKKINSIRKKLK